MLITVSPAPTGENTKKRQLEYDGLGRLTSVCELTAGTAAWLGGTCAQSLSQTGYWTKYAYDPLGDLLTVTQNAQSSSNQQNRTYTYDALQRLTSEKNPETASSAITYTYDTDTTCTPASAGDLVKKVDPAGNTICYTYDYIHRMTGITYPSGPYSTSTQPKSFVYDTATVDSQTMLNAKGHLADAYTGASSTKTTDLGFSYTARGEISDTYEMMPVSIGYYHVSQSYYGNGAPDQLSSSISGLPTITNLLDGEGRINQVTASTGQNPVTNVLYNSAQLPTTVNFGSGDSDTFTYDPNTMRMTQYKFTVGATPQSLTGTLTWNANATLSKQVIVDPFNSSDAQTCNYTHDDLIRIVTANCGSAAAQTFSYDPFGNIDKSGSPYSFLPTYSAATNRMTSLSDFTPTYDGNGNLTNDSVNNYSWDADGNAIGLDSVSFIYYDALDRMVEQNDSGAALDVIYAPNGAKLALFDNYIIQGSEILKKAFVPLPGSATAVYTSSGLNHYRHSDWLGSARLISTPAQTVSSTTAYAPFGEPYAQSGTVDSSFTGQNQDTASGIYDFAAREYSMQGRWASPDPSGIAAVNPSYPQSWNRYAYVLNNPLKFVDPNGYDCAYLNDSGDGIESLDQNSNSGECTQNGGYWADGAITNFQANSNGGYSFTSLDANLNTLYTNFNGSGNSSPSVTGDVMDYFMNYMQQAQLQQNPSLWSMSPQQRIYQIALAQPTICGGGTFSYAGGEASVGAGHVFNGGIVESDSRDGVSIGSLTEVAGGEGYTAGGGLITTTGGNVEPIAFVGGGGDVGVSEASAGAFATPGSVGLYGEVGAGGRVVGGGVYANITTNGACLKK
jgi:RHS repeat-associated protein